MTAINACSIRRTLGVLGFVFAVAHVPIAFGADVLWTNATGNGRWSDAGNWRDSQKPVAGDVVYTSNTVAGASIWVDEPIDVRSIRLEGTEDLTFYGEKMTLSEGWSFPSTSGTPNQHNYHNSRAAFLAYVSGATVSNEVELVNTGTTGVITARRNLVFAGKVSVLNATTFYHHNGLTLDTDGYSDPSPQPTLAFLGGLVAQKAVVRPTSYPNSFVRFEGKVDVKQLTTTDYTSAYHVLATDDITVQNGTMDLYYTCVTYTDMKNALPANTVLVPKNLSSGATNQKKYRGVNLLGHDQTIDRLEGDANFAATTMVCANVYSTESTSSSTAALATLTLRATASAVTPLAIADVVSIVYDPVGDFTQTFSNRIHTTKGTLTVKGGTVSLKGATTFAKLERATVLAGAQLEVETTGDPVFGDDMILDVKGTLRVAEGARLFASGKGTLNVGGGRIVLPAGATLTLNTLMVNGVPQAASTYTAGEPGADWLVGEGATVTVVEKPVGSYWAAPEDGTWGTATAWTPVGVPTTEAKILADTKDFTVTVAEDAETVNGLRLENSDRTTTLSVEKALTVARPLLDIGKGVIVDVPAGGTMTFDAGTYTTPAEYTVRRIDLHDGGELRVSGGTFETTALNGGWDVRNGSRITVSSGTFNFKMEGVTSADNWACKSTGLRIYDGCSLVVTGGVLQADCLGWNPVPFIALYGGSALFGKDAELRLNQTQNGYLTLFGSGKARFEDSAKFSTNGSRNNYLYFAATQSMPAEVEFVDHTVFNGPQQVFLGTHKMDNSGTKMRYASDQTSYVAQQFMHVGVDFGNSELAIESGKIQTGGGGLHIGGWGKSDNEKTRAHKASGVVNMTGGTIEINNGGGIIGVINGLIVGNGSSVYNGTSALKSTFTGTLNLSAGTITHSKGNTLDNPYLIVGIGAAEGTINQTGGTISFKPLGNWTSPVFAVIGMGGATGTWNVSGGTVELGNDLYLGGCSAGTEGAFKQAVPLLASSHVYPGADKHDAVGVLSLSGGTFSVGKDLVMSEDGTGTLELKPGAKLIVGGKLDARTGSKLVIDARGFAGKSQTLATFGGTVQGFSEDNIEFLQDDAQVAYLITENGIKLYENKGTVLIFR